MSDYYPPPSFYFSLTVLGVGALQLLVSDVDAAFQEITGIQAEFGIEEQAEGGENRFLHRLPKQTKYSNLVLKRGAVSQASFLAEWVGQTVGSGLALPIITQNLLVTLLNADGVPSIAWGFINAWPVKWEMSAFDSQANKVLTESLEFSYNHFERLNLGSPVGAAVKLAQFAAGLTRR